MRSILPLVSLISGAVFAQSPRAVLGWGLESSSADGPSRALGEAGQAMRSDRQWEPRLEARSAFGSLTAFEVQAAPGYSTIDDGAKSNTVGDASLPRMSLSIPMNRFGHLGLGYWQRFRRGLDFRSADSLVDLKGEGGAFEALVGYSIAIPWSRGLALGLTYHRVLGTDRLIRTESYAAHDQYADYLVADSLQRRYWGDYWTASSYFTKGAFDLGVWVDLPGEVEVSSTRRSSGQEFTPQATRTLEPPRSMGTAAAWRLFDRQTAVGSFSTTDWSDVQPGSSRQFQGGLGWQFQGSNERFDDYWRKISYRLGTIGAFGGPGEVVTMAGTGGLGLPLGDAGTLDLSLQVGQNEVDNGGPSLKETFVRLYVTVTGASTWGRSFRSRR